MAAVVYIFSRLSLCIDSCRTNQPNRSKLGHLHSKMTHFSYKDGCGEHGRCTHINVFKEELAWDTDIWPRVINNMLFKTVIPLRN